MSRKNKLTPGHPLREATRVNQLGVSRGPIREVFRALEERGLVTVEKNQGVFLRVITAQLAVDNLEVLTALEKIIVSRIAKAPDCLHNPGLPQLLSKATKLAAKADFSARLALNIQFHERLTALAGDRRLLNTYRRLVNELSLFRQQAHARQTDASSLKQSVDDHKVLLEALLMGDQKKLLKYSNCMWMLSDVSMCETNRGT